MNDRILSDDEVVEALKSLNLVNGASDFTVKSSTIGRVTHFWLTDATRGFAFDELDGELTQFTVCTDNEIFDIWHENHFVDYGENYYRAWKKHLLADAESIIFEEEQDEPVC